MNFSKKRLLARIENINVPDATLPLFFLRAAASR
jgi:hypothetical protein